MLLIQLKRISLPNGIVVEGGSGRSANDPLVIVGARTTQDTEALFRRLLKHSNEDEHKATHGQKGGPR